VTDGPAKPLNPLRWLGLPALICALATLLLTAPIRIGGFRLPEPIFAMVPAFAWAMIRPSILPPFVLMALGLYMDVLWGGPSGLWPASLLAAYAPVLALRSVLAGQGAPVMWGLYALSCAMCSGTALYVMTLDSGAMPNLIAVGWQFLVTAALYPFAHRLIERYEDADVRFR
jgi:rod shape-determining protein MreD